MLEQSEKIGFWSVFALVVGSQLGSGVFMLPSTLAPYGGYSILGWILSGVGAVALALVFAGLCRQAPRTGGPHVYVKSAFGPTAAFFTGWTYWIISWISTTAVIITSIGYLSPFIGNQSPWIYLMLELLLLGLMTWLNLKGIQAAARAEFVLTVLKVIPLLLLPLAAAWYFDASHFVIQPAISALPVSTTVAQVILLTLWGFIGLECATTSAGSVENPAYTIPKAIILGTLTTALIYVINSVGVMGLVPGAVLSASKAPYVEAAQYLFGANGSLLISVIASVVCIGTINAWMLTSGQIALGLAEDKLMPQIFAMKNKKQAPTFALIISSLGMVPLLVLTVSDNMAKQITTIIDFSVVAFLFVYLICTLAYVKQLLASKSAYYHWLYTVVALVFCVWIIAETPLAVLETSSVFVLLSVPVYLWWYRRGSRANVEASLIVCPVELENVN